MYAATVRSRTSNCPCRKPPVRDTGHKTDFQLYPSFYLPPRHHLTIPDSRTANAPQISSHEIMSVCSGDAGNSWGQSKRGCPRFCPLMKVGSRSARPWSRPGMLASMRAHTAVTFSGIILDSAILIEIPGKIRCAPWKSVSSVQCVSPQPTGRRAALFLRLSCSKQLDPVRSFAVLVQK